MKSLAEFKRYLATPGAAVRTVSIYGNPAPAKLAMWRTVAVLQTNAVAFVSATDSGKSWLFFPAASKVSFDGHLINLDGIVYEWKAA